MNSSISAAMRSVDVGEYTDYELEPFWHDRPLVFLDMNALYPVGGVILSGYPLSSLSIYISGYHLRGLYLYPLSSRL